MAATSITDNWWREELMCQINKPRLEPPVAPLWPSYAKKEEKNMFKIRIDDVEYTVQSDKPVVKLAAVLVEAQVDLSTEDLFYITKEQTLANVEENAVIPANQLQQFFTEGFCEFV